MYYDHFGLSEPPFRITPDTRLFFPGGSRGAILDAIVYAITSGEGIVKVIGEVGSGKTMICRMLEVKLPASVEVVYLANPSLSPDNILHAIAFEMKLDLPTGAGRLEVMHALHARLLDKHADNRQVVMFVEEAQRMPLETLEEIRLLSNLETEREKLLQIVLFGQPELERNLSPAHIRQLKERITHGFLLPRLEAEEIREYLDFRMRSAGYKGPPVFSPAAVKRIARASEGLIRRINVLADKALLAAYAGGTHQVTPREVRSAIRDSEFGGARWTMDWRLAGLFGAAALGAGVMWVAQTGYRYIPWLASTADAGVPTTAASGPVVRSEPALPPAVTPAAARAEPTAPALASTPPAPLAPEAGVPAPLVIAAVDPATEPASDSAPAASSGPPAGAEASVPAAVPAREPRVEPVAVAGVPVANPGPSAAIPAQAQAAAATAERPAEPPRVASGAESANGAREAAAPSSGAAGAATNLVAVATAAGTGRAAGEGAPGRASPGRDSTYVARRLAATGEWLKTADASRYSIQLMHIGIDRGAGLEASLRQGGLGAELDRVWVYRTRIAGVELLSVLLGDYPSQEEARRVLEGLPPGLRQAKPFVRTLRDIRAGGAGVSG
jgi:type II secretory pathway predicted ATPase ExeA